MQEDPRASKPIAKELGRIVVYRTGIMGTAIQPTVEIDNVQKGKCQPKGVFTADVPAGNRVVAATTEVRRETVVTVERGKASYVRCGIGFGVLVGQPRLEVVPEETGRTESAALAYTGHY